MCGRFTQTRSRDEILDELCGIELPPLFHRRYNIAPMQTVGVIRQDQTTPPVEAVWGFSHPHSGAPVINARYETLNERPMFRDLIAANKCLIPADGFFEWQEKQPYYFQLEGHQLFAFAGLWSRDRCVIVTREADENMRGIHNRMPLMLPWKDRHRWLERCHLPAAPRLTCRPVSRRVNSVSHDDPACLDPADLQTDLFLFPDDD